MEVTITVSAEGEEPVEVYRSRTPVVGGVERRHAVESEIDLGRWEGRLVRLDVRGEVRAPGPLPLQRGRIACSAALGGPDGAQILEFVGWENQGSWPFHFGRIGCPTLAVPGGSSVPFVFSESGSLWHVLRVPARSALRVALKPVLAGEAEEAKPFLGVGGSQPAQGIESHGTEEERRHDVFIYLVDALRADHLSCYGYSRKTSPEIDRFAAGATLYEQAQTASTWTRPSIGTLLSGLYPPVHGAMNMKEATLDEWPVLLPEMLHERGYATYAVITNTTVGEKTGFNQGYDGFQCELWGSAGWVNARVAEDLARQPPEQPVFVYAHIMEPHLPYTPRPESLELFDRGSGGRGAGLREARYPTGRISPRLSAEDIEHLIDLYDAEVYEADQGFAEFLELLRRAGRLGNALIVLVADHGEAFGEHRTLGHARTLNQEELHVPLIIRYPNGRFRGVRVSQRVSLMDVLPTILAVLGIEPELDYALVGRNLVPPALASGAASSRRIYCEVSRDPDDRLDLVGVIDEDGYKRVLDTSRPMGRLATKEAIGLWNTEEDVGEQVDLRSTNPVRAAYDEQLIARWLQEQRYWRYVLAGGPAPAVELTDEMREDLRALGYLD
jgi:arylsulfatase